MDLTAINNNPYLGKTRPGPGYEPRPRADAGLGRGWDAETLRRAQQQWDAAEAWRAENDDIQARRLAALDEARRARAEQWDREDAERRRRRLDAALAPAKAAYLAAGGSEAAWETSGRQRAEDDYLHQQAMAATARPIARRYEF